MPATIRDADDPIYKQPAPRRPVLDIILPLSAGASGVMLFMAMPNIIQGDGWWMYAKAATLALTGSLIAYGVNRLALERGAPLGTTGYHGATLTSVLTIGIVGGGLFSATYSGLVYKDVAALQLQEHSEALSAYVSNANAAASSAGRIAPAIQAIASDLGQKAACEVETSCISGRGGGGNGTVARVVAEHAGRAAVIAEQVTAGETARQQIAAQLGDRLAEYNAIVADESADIWVRRTKLQKADAEIRAGVGALQEAAPVALLSAYAAELGAGASIPGRPEAEARLGDMLRRYGQGLASVVDSIGQKRLEAPAFPARTGVSDTFGYMLHFLPIAAITGVVELVFPLALWGYTFWTLAWDKHRQQRARNAGAGAHPTRPNGAPPSQPNGADRQALWWSAGEGERNRPPRDPQA
ncbi:MAG: hypothetical protein AB7P20_03085 [Rhizobiaceae bacterium]